MNLLWQSFMLPIGQFFSVLTGQMLKNNLAIWSHCNWNFHRICFRTKLVHHVKTLHEGERSFKCQHCSKRFTSKSNMKVHEGVMHTGKPVSFKIKPKTIYFCCGQFFLFLKNGPTRPLFRLFLVFSNKHHYNFYNKYMWKMSIQYTVPGFKPTTFGTWVSSHNH